MQVDEEQYPKDDVKNHLSQYRRELRVNCQLVQVEVEHVHVVVWVLVFQGLEVHHTLPDLMPLPPDHHREVQPFHLWQEQDSLDDAAVRVVQHSKD